jgi:tryptophan synthase, alpha subunit
VLLQVWNSVHNPTNESDVNVNRIRTVFQQLQSQKRKAIVPYITPEFPIAGTTVPLILGLEKAGASLIEVGIPFSDPIADGVTIQHSSHIAIQNGATIGKVLESVTEARRLSAIPVVLMGYVNPILRYGMERFLQEAGKCGVDGVIVPDLLPEESDEWRSLSSKYAVSNIYLIAPTTSEKRIQYIDSISSDFSYCVSVIGVTGARSNFGDSDTFTNFLRRVKENTVKPFVVGFGISKREQIAMMCRYADGVVVGSALLRSIENEKSIDEVVTSAAAFFSSLVEV